MKLLLSLCLVLVLLSCCDATGGDAGSHEEEESTTEYYDYSTATATPDYDYNATFDYYFVTGLFHDEVQQEVRSKAAGIGPFSPLLLLGLAVRHIWD